MKLKPCPFCGREPHVSTDGEYYFIECGNSNGVNTYVGDMRDKAIMLWNTRAEEPAEQKTAHWDIAVGCYTPFCSNCGEEPPAYEMTPFCPHCGAKMVTRERN